MIPMMHTLTRPQRARYVLSLLLVGAGWLLLLALILEWSSGHWSRAARAAAAALPRRGRRWLACLAGPFSGVVGGALEPRRAGDSGGGAACGAAARAACFGL